MTHKHDLHVALVVGFVFVSCGLHSDADEKNDAGPKTASAERKSNQSPKQGALLLLTAPFDEGQAKAAQEAWARTLGRSSPVEKNSIGMELVLIPPGKFIMGSPASEKDPNFNERQVNVTLTKSFYLGKTEVTQGQWRAVMETTPWKGRQLVREGDGYPVTYVSWDDAKTFCKKLGEKDSGIYRLPTEGGVGIRMSCGYNDAVQLWGRRTRAGQLCMVGSPC